jgi:2-keto-4-pentenoate hydratase/2-oxohepta-3-ene-1,7-dioic acid hydratase in catechol pathway
MMKLVAFSVAGSKVRPGALIEDAAMVVDLTAGGYPDTLSAIATGFTSLATPGSYPGHKLTDVRLHAPLTNPPRIFAIGLNYRDHARESKMELPAAPVVFFKLQTAIIGPNEAIVLPKNSSEPDYEAELAFVVGRGGFRIPASSWRDHVYGYTIINDVSARDVQRSTSQWTLAKSFPTFCPMGPAITPIDEVPDPHNLSISLEINGEMLQNSNTRELVFTIPELIEYISSITPLLPGDIVSTGTPGGVGMVRSPQRWLRSDDTVTVTIEDLGSLANPVVSEA